METQKSTIETLTRAQIRAEVKRFSERERELTELAAQMYRNGQAGAGAAIGERERVVHERARQLLNGHGGLLPSLPNRLCGEQEVIEERDAVRLVLAALSRADVEAETVEAVRWAEAHKAEWFALLRDWVLAAARFEAVEARVGQYRERAGAREHALALTNSVAGRGCEIYRSGYWVALEEIFSAAVEGGAVSAGDLRKVRRGEGPN